jgi:PASTA domain
MKTARNYLAIGIIAAAALTGCGASTSAPAPKTAAATTQAAGGFALPDYEGKRLDVAIEELKKADITYDAEAVNGKAVLRAKNWTIASQAPAAGTKIQAGEKVTFQVHKPEETSAPAAPSQTSAAPAPPTPTSPPTPTMNAKEASNHWWYDAGGNRINSTISVLNQYVAATLAGDFGEAQARCSQLQEYVALSSPQKLEALPDLNPVVGKDLVQAFEDGKEGTLVAARQCSKFFEKNDQGALTQSRQFANAAANELDNLQTGLLGLQGLKR